MKETILPPASLLWIKPFTFILNPEFKIWFTGFTYIRSIVVVKFKLNMDLIVFPIDCCQKSWKLCVRV